MPAVKPVEQTGFTAGMSTIFSMITEFKIFHKIDL